MKASTLILRSLRHYWRTHLGVVLGAALGALVLTGSLLVGDSVKATLHRQAQLRVGQVDAALVGGDRFFREQLAAEAGPEVAPVLLLRGSVAKADGSARVNQAQVLGVDERFWKLGPPAPLPGSDPAPSAWLNERLAAQLAVKEGDTLIVRVEKPGLFSRDAPLSGEENEVVALRAKILGALGGGSFGRFSLQAGQVPPFSIFLPLKYLQERVAMAGRANVLLARDGTALKNGVAAHWQLADAALELRPVEETGALDLRTGRVFMEKPVIDAAPKGTDVLTYLVNELRAGDKATPYSMVTAIDAASCGFLPAELADDEIVINQWLAEDLGVHNGDKITLKYFVMGERRALEERSREFNVLSVMPMEEPQLNSSWMPDFPGLTDKKNCREWAPGFDIDVTRFRDKDQQYWDAHRGTPKAFINIALGQKLWANRWGELTSIRYSKDAAQAQDIAGALRKKLSLEQAGVQWVPLREQAFAATQGPVDFAELFVYFSFFLIVAAAVLTGLLFVFSIEQRHAETGLLLALGWRPRAVRRLFMGEGAVLALIGSVLGVIGALIYTKLVLRALATVWRSAVGGVEFVFAPNVPTFAIGIVSGVFIAFVAMWLAGRRQFSQTARGLLSGEESAASGKDGKRNPRKGAWTRAAAAVALIGAVVMGIFAGGSPELFFGAGALLLMAGLFLAHSWLRGSAVSGGAGLESLAQLGARNAGRRRGRSLATIAVLASGVFIVVAVDSFRQRPPAPGGERQSGTGGFALVGEAALPIYDDLNTAKGREGFLLDEKTLAEVSVVPVRVRDGDDASCLNLNRALQPRLLGVKPGDLESRRAFVLKWRDKAQAGWLPLEKVSGDGALSGLTDEATLMWALKMKLGDTIEYKDERGVPFKVRIEGVLKGSLLQGNVVIAEDRFIEKFPGQGGYRYFLVDAPVAKTAEVAEHFSRALQDRGFEATPAWRRLAEFQAVENTYLSIFQVLGGLGLLLGSAGLAIVVGRNVLERRGEFGLMEAMGFTPGQLRGLVFAEHRWLIVCGLGIGVASALLAVWPGLRERAGGFPFAQMAALVAALVAGCVFWAWLATRLALRGSRIAALRNE